MNRRPVPLRFRDALRGLAFAWREEPNLRVHGAAAAIVLAVAIAVPVQVFEGLYLLGTITLVLVTEAVNTAIERTVDLAAAGRRSLLARQAKEVAAAAVLLSVVHAVAAGAYIFGISHGPAAVWQGLLRLYTDQPGLGLFLSLLVLTAVLAGRYGGRERGGQPQGGFGVAGGSQQPVGKNVGRKRETVQR